MQLRRVSIHPKGPRSTQFVFAVSSAQEPNAQHACSPRCQQIPDRIPNYITIACSNTKPLLAGKEKIRFRFGPGHIAALDYNSSVCYSKHSKRSIDLGATTG